MPRPIYIAICSALLFFAIVPLKVFAQGGSMEEDILYYTNKYRQSKGKPPLELNSAISKEARNHSRDMAAGRTGFGHGGFSQRTARLKDKLGNVSGAGENVAYGDLDAEAVVQLWIKSAPHRKNLLGNYNLMGVGTANGKRGVVYFTQFFIKR
jgi:uncharacterized protein YkwD